ncbi:MAG: antA/AntB antirepressor family protein [Vogesella sp.]|uniref:antA/AntB antirepressor family protein n=1 Tax=Vogesella sp. TaxID=1904252 RepID=UPI00391B0D96
MQPLIPLSTRRIGDDAIQTVNARELHAFLEVGKVFAAWIQERIQQYGFVENQDYVIGFPNLENQNTGWTVDSPILANQQVGRGGDRRSKEYHLTLDMAKELAMVERNQKGREARRYFIQCEKALHAQQAKQPSEAPPLASVQQRVRQVLAAARCFNGILKTASQLQLPPGATLQAANHTTLHHTGVDLLAAMGLTIDTAAKPAQGPAPAGSVYTPQPASPPHATRRPFTTPQPEDALVNQLRRWLAEPPQAHLRQFTTEDMMAALPGSAATTDRATATRIGQAMARLGWVKRRLPPDSQGHRHWVYCRPA